MTLPEKLLTLHRALAGATIPHAFGGAIALAYWTLDPRGTRDIDINVFVGSERASDVLDVLPPGIERGPADLAAINRDGQVRLLWGETPVDLFFDTVALHGAAADHSRVVPFEDASIPVLGPVELACFKALFDRGKDWVDIEAMVAGSTLDVDAVRVVLEDVVGESDPRIAKLDDAVERAIRDAR